MLGRLRQGTRVASKDWPLSTAVPPLECGTPIVTWPEHAPPRPSLAVNATAIVLRTFLRSRKKW